MKITRKNSRTAGPPMLQICTVSKELGARWGGQPDFISLIQKLLSLSNHPSFHSSFHSSKDRFHHILGVNCTNIEFWVALVMIYAVLSNFDFVAKFTVKNLNKDFINAGRGGEVTVL